MLNHEKLNKMESI